MNALHLDLKQKIEIIDKQLNHYSNDPRLRNQYYKDVIKLKQYRDKISRMATETLDSIRRLLEEKPTDNTSWEKMMFANKAMREQAKHDIKKLEQRLKDFRIEE